MKSWHPPLILLAMILPAVIGFALGGPGFGIMLAGFSLVGLIPEAAMAGYPQSVPIRDFDPAFHIIERRLR